MYEPTACRLYHQIQSTDIIPGTQEYVCGDKGVNCSWGDAVNIANRYVYVAQPKKDRILVISKIQMVVVDVSAPERTSVQITGNRSRFPRGFPPALNSREASRTEFESESGTRTPAQTREFFLRSSHRSPGGTRKEDSLTAERTCCRWWSPTSTRWSFTTCLTSTRSGCSTGAASRTRA